MLTFLATLIPWAKRWWKPIALVLVAGAVVWYVWSSITTYGQERYDAGFANRDAQYKDELQKLQAQYVKQVETLQRTNHELSTTYASELAAIRDRPAGKPVWMCDAPASGVPKAPGAGSTAGTDGTSAQGLPEAPRRDIGPFLYGEADDADALAAQLSTLQEWVDRVCVKREHLRTAF